MDCWRVCDDAVKARNADVARKLAHLIPNPSPFAGRVGLIHGVAPKSILMMVGEPQCRMMSIFSRSA